ncbi:3'-5' exonuclease [Roseateles violae]|uniref:3'-5' exonuclease n=1 Tax=Roseateles violae TaxID=3058042 RepID=A0ABT8DML6_9BURK|nr:3'-5' exonuclease [Pelomonas sp. PFR6]MDN3919178.1 3'-5' exonuclease [Pelomonas sp. PFR6]
MSGEPQARRLSAPSKDETALLPPFEGLGLAQIVVPRTAAQFEAAVDELLASGVAGFDTEAKPTFAAGQASEGPHVLQFALADKAFIIQPQREGATAALTRLLEAESLTKVGFGLQSDRSQIQARFGLTMRAVLDLDGVFRRLGYPKSIGVRAAVGLMLGLRFHKSKKTTTSNWALPRLGERQLLYAANDAYAALMVYRALQRDGAALR